MPDSGIADGATFNSAFWDDYVREQVITTCTSGTRPSHVAGRVIAETDTKLFQVSDGSAWIPLGGWGAYQTYTPTLTNVTGGAASGWFRQTGKTGHLHLSITAGTATAAAAVTVTLPAGWTCARVMPAAFLLQVGGASTSLVSGRILAGGTTATMYASTAGANFGIGASVISSASLVMELS